MIAGRLPGPRERWLLVAAIAVGILLRLASGWHTSLWIDETYTGVIAGQPTSEALFGWLRHELSGPVYYTMAWIVARFGGLSDAALRAPSHVMAIGSVLLVAWKGHPDTRIRLLWAALLALWWPGVVYAGQARPQALLTLLAVVQSIAFLRLCHGRSVGAAWVWSIATSLMVLTHLYAAVPGGAQALFLAWTLRGHWRRFIAPLAAFAPTAVWYGAQLSYYADVARPGRTFHPAFGWKDAHMYPAHLVGGTPMAAFLLLGLSAGIGLLAIIAKKRSDGRWPVLPAEAVLALTGVLAALAIFVIAIWRASYIDRYLVPCAPASLLGIAFVMARASGTWAGTTRVFVPFLLLQAAILALATLPARFQEEAFPAEFARASAWLMEDGRPARPVVFTWDSPAMTINSDRDLQEIGGFFFTRAGAPRPIVVARVPAGAAGAEPLAALARKHSADIVWLGDKAWPRRLMDEPGLECRLFHRGNVSQVVVCRNLARPPSVVTTN